MFEKSIEIISNAFLQYKGNGMYMALFLLGMLYIYLNEKDKKMRCLFLYFPLATLFVILNPLFNKCVGKIFTGSVYWRLFWILPIGITIAYCLIKFVQDQKEKSQKIIVGISLVAILIVSGRFMYIEENFQKVGNLYKLPDDPVWVAQLIGADKSEHKKALVPDTVVPYIRQIDANIELAYRREPEGYANHDLVRELAAGNVEFIANYAIKNNCNYVVFNGGVVLTDKMENYGFEKMNQTVFYVIYKYTGENKI